jgi:hypothetical protein
LRLFRRIFVLGYDAELRHDFKPQEMTMNVLKKSKKDGNVAQRGEGCCGGPAPEGVAACCVQDAEAKASGEGGCGCGASPVQTIAPPSACCGAGSQTPEETSFANIRAAPSGATK